MCSNTLQLDGRELAYWVMTQAFWLAVLKTDGPITGNITGSCHIRGYHGYHGIARWISNKIQCMVSLVPSLQRKWNG